MTQRPGRAELRARLDQFGLDGAAPRVAAWEAFLADLQADGLISPAEAATLAERLGAWATMHWAVEVSRAKQILNWRAV